MTDPCIGDPTCGHFMKISWSPVEAVIQHGDNPKHRYTAEPGIYPEGMCDDGHDLALERWINAMMDEAGCRD